MHALPQPGRLLLLVALAMGGASCQHAPTAGPGTECESFAEYDATTRRQLDALLTDAPGDRLVTEASRLNRERRACAKQVLARLPQLRESRGIEALQRELDALVGTYRPDDLDALLVDALGTDAVTLRPYLAEARVKLERERRAPAAERRDRSAAHQGGTDTTALEALDQHQAHADRDATTLLDAHAAERRRADRDAAGSLDSLDRTRRDADRESAALLDRQTEAARRADGDASTSLGRLEAERRAADRDAATLLARQGDSSRRADRDASTGFGHLDQARTAADQDAARWVTGSASSDLPPLRAADDVTAEALRSFAGSDAPGDPCATADACARLRCEDLPESRADALARRCLDDVSALPHDVRAKQVAAVLTRLRAFGPLPSTTEALATLETLRRQDWPGIEALVASGRRGLAAQRASPFLALDGARAQVQRLRDDAQAHHLRRAKDLAGTPTAAWVHARLAEELGGPTAAPLPEKGRWGPPRWRCGAPAPEALPPLRPGLEATLHASCAEPRKTSEAKNELRTFDLDVGGVRVEGSVVVACADKLNSFSFRIEEPGVSGFPTAALDTELQRLVGLATKACREQHALAAIKGCAELNRRTPAELLRRFTLHALATGQWATCFREWLETTEGAAPPRLD